MFFFKWLVIPLTYQRPKFIAFPCSFLAKTSLFVYLFYLCHILVYVFYLYPSDLDHCWRIQKFWLGVAKTEKSCHVSLMMFFDDAITMTSLKWRKTDFLKFNFIIIKLSLKKHNFVKPRNFRSPKSKIKGVLHGCGEHTVLGDLKKWNTEIMHFRHISCLKIWNLLIVSS